MRLENVSKIYTAALILELTQDEKLRVTDTVARWVPGLLPYGNRITIRELLTMSSGLIDNTAMEFENLWRGGESTGCAGQAFGWSGGGSGFKTEVWVDDRGSRVAVLLLNARHLSTAQRRDRARDACAPLLRFLIGALGLRALLDHDGRDRHTRPRAELLDDALLEPVGLVAAVRGEDDLVGRELS